MAASKLREGAYSKVLGANLNLSQIIEKLRDAIPNLSAVYLFGSRAQDQAGPDSDLDIAILSDAPIDALNLWDLSSELANLAGCSVDLLDLRTASTVMQYQIITTGQRLWARDTQAALFECFILSEKTRLDEARAELIKDIQRTGSIYGR